jgi:hypothetical protein
MRIQFQIQGFDDQKLTKIYKWNFFLIILNQELKIFLSLGFPKGRQRYERSLQPSKENIQHFRSGSTTLLPSFEIGVVKMLESEGRGGGRITL